MKTYNNLWEKTISNENILLAIKDASKGKRDRRYVKQVLEHTDFYVDFYRSYAWHFQNRPHAPKEIYDGIRRKKRYIIVPTFDEQVIHHMVVNVLKPIIMKPMYEHAYGSIPGRGSFGASKYVRRWVKKSKYCLQMDIRKFFDSIPHDKLIAKLRRKIKDERFMKLVEMIISVQPKGIPLEFYTSQWFANFYMTDLDHYIKEDLGATYYMRYMDDMIVLGANKRRLHRIRQAIAEYLATMGLRMKSSWQVYPIKSRAVDFMGFRFFRNRTTMRRSIYLRMCRKARKIAKKPKPTIHDCRQFISYIGWLKETDVYEAYLKWVKPLISFQSMKRYVSRTDRRYLCGAQ